MAPLITKTTITRAQIADLPEYSSGPIERGVVIIAGGVGLVQVGGETVWDGDVDGVEVVRARRAWNVMHDGEVLFEVTRDCGCKG